MSYESLPWVDTPASEQQLAAAKALIEGELDSDTSALHPNVSATYEPNFSDLIEAQHTRIENGQQRMDGGIDLSRYEAVEPPTTTPTSDEDKPEILKQWKDILNKAYASHAYLYSRQQNLGLLETYGKNAWLISNSQLEDELRALERELGEKKKDLQEVQDSRRFAQESVKGEMDMLEEGWKQGIRRLVETEAAAEQLRRLALQRRREEATG